MIYVTNDQMEAVTLATKTIVFRGGMIVLFGSPVELYETSRNMFVTQFIGSRKMNFFRVIFCPTATCIAGTRKL